MTTPSVSFGLLAKLRLAPPRKTERSFASRGFSYSPATRGLDISRVMKTSFTCHGVTVGGCLAVILMLGCGPGAPARGFRRWRAGPVQ